MIMLILKNYKAVLAFITMLVVPMVLASWGFLLTTSQTNAKMPMIETRVQALEQVSYRLDERYQFIQEALKEIKANQERLAKIKE
jgi:ABC-type siderophore export system fused ATPase/permease subunit